MYACIQSVVQRKGGATIKPAPFGYHAAASVDEAVSLLAAYEGTARPLAGGQSLGPMLNMRLVRPDALIDLNPVKGLGFIDAIEDGTSIGALVRYSAIERSLELAARLPLLVAVMRHIGDRQVRNRGTVGGSLAHGDPTGEVALVCMVLDAAVRVAGPEEGRLIAVRDLYESSYATVLGPTEIITEVRFPAAPQFHGFLEMCRRHNDFAVVSVACAGDRTADGSWRDVRLGLGGVAETPVRAVAAEEELEGSSLDDASIAAAGRAALEAADPASDIRASAAYRRHLVPVYVRRVLTAMRRSAHDEPLERRDIA